MSTPSPSQPRPPEKSPGSPSNEPAKQDGESAGAANSELTVTQPTNLNVTSMSGGGSAAGREWSNLPELRESDFRQPRRRLLLPLVLFVATCLSTFWVGAANW